MPQNIVDAFHQVRIIGNKDSHGNEITEAEIDNCLDSLFEIVVWLVIGHDEKIYKSDNFLAEDLKVVDKYLADDIKAKRDKLKDIGTFINSLEFSKDELSFDNEVIDELQRDVFETNEEYIARIDKLPLYHIGYAILDNRTNDKYTGLTFAMFHIEKSNKIIFSKVNALVSKMDKTAEYFIDGKIVVGLKVYKDKVYCDYDRIFLQSQSGNNIKLTAICWDQYGYETEKDFNRRLKSLPVMPIGVSKPIRKDYNLETKILPFKVALYEYVQSILDFDKVNVTAERSLAKNFCDDKEYFQLYGKIDKLLNVRSWQATLRNIHHDEDIICTKNA